MWSQFNPVRVHAGAGARHRLTELLPQGHILLVATEGMLRRGNAQELMDACAGRSWKIHTVGPNPDLDQLDAFAAAVQGTDFAAIAALGGGSVLDAAKALAVALPTKIPAPLDAWLRQSAALPWPRPLPLFCLPSTSGTGAEVTPFATIWDNREQLKRSLAHESLYPHTALLDPELTASLPWEITLYCGLDVLSHALESLWNRRATPVSAALARQSLHLAVPALRALHTRLDDPAAREALQQASLLAGLAISQNRTALAHSMSYPLTLAFGMPHGLACGFTLAAIAAAVHEAGAWHAGTDTALTDAAAALLRELDLPRHVRKYCTPEQVLARKNDMFTPDRAGNFVLNPTMNTVERILLRSME